MYTDSLVTDVAPAVNAALQGCKYNVTSVRESFAAAAESAAEDARPQVHDVGKWLVQAMENICQ